jgi:hypothetical protein
MLIAELIYILYLIIADIAADLNKEERVKAIV